MITKAKTKKAKETVGAETQDYTCTVKGEYYAATVNGTVLKPYELTVKLSHEDVDAGALSVVKNVFLAKTQYMNKKYPDYQGCLTHHLVSLVAPPGGKKKLSRRVEIDLMDEETLIEFAEEKEINILWHLYLTIGDKRSAVKQAVDDPEGYENVQERFRQLNEDRILREQRLLLLNDGDADDGESAQEDANDATEEL